MRILVSNRPAQEGLQDYRLQKAKVELLTTPILLILKIIITALPRPSIKTQHAP